ncbi:MAG: S1 RNA-binding domain-containing protein, partial [Syntrophorhabdales bacterium]
MVETVDTSAQKEGTEQEMEELYETSLKNLQEGNIIKGRVLDINGDSVIVDVGLKSEGRVSLSEFLDKSGASTVGIGDEVEVMIMGREVKDGLLTLSKQRVDGIKLWQAIDRSLEEGTPVEGTIVSEVKGGFIVD